MTWWDVTNVEDYENKCFRPAEKYEDSDDGYVVKLTTERVIYACEAVQMSGIEPDNVDEFYIRYLVHSRAIQRNSKKYLTLQDIEAHVGIETGGGTKSQQHFDKTISEIMRAEATWSQLRARESAEGGE